jgi:TonB family protein
VQQVLERSLGPYEACVAQRAGTRVAGELHLRVHVEANGVPIAASVDRSNVGDRALERCLVAATEAWRFAERDAATLVTFSLRVGQGEPTGSQRDVGDVISLGESGSSGQPAAHLDAGGGRHAGGRRPQ